MNTKLAMRLILPVTDMKLGFLLVAALTAFALRQQIYA